MRRGKHSPPDGPSGRSGGLAAGRAAALLAVAVVIGVVLLNAADDAPEPRVAAGGDTTSTPSTRAETTTTVGVTTTTVPARAPKEVKVLSGNGTDVKGSARKATDLLRAAGYNVLAPVDVAKKVTVSAIYFAAGYEREAQAVASVLALGPDAVKALPAPPPIPDVRGANVLVIVGPELAARVVGTAPTTTTRAGGTVTTTTRAVGTASTTTSRP